MKLTIGTFAAFLSGTASASVVSLNSSNYQQLTSGKSVFIKFFAPWCGHCKAMAEDWVAIGEEFGEGGDILIGEVDCTDEEAGNVNFCTEQNVQGFPTLRFGQSFDLQDYEGDRDYESLSAFTKQNLGPQCGPENQDLCDEEQKEMLAKFMNMPNEELQALIDSNDEKIAQAQDAFESGVQVLEDEYDQAQGGTSGPEETIMQLILHDRDTVEKMLKLSDEELTTMLEQAQEQQLSDDELQTLVESLQKRYEVLQNDLDAQREEVFTSGLALMHSVAQYKSKSEIGKEL